MHRGTTRFHLHYTYIEDNSETRKYCNVNIYLTVFICKYLYIVHLQNAHCPKKVDGNVNPGKKNGISAFDRGSAISSHTMDAVVIQIVSVHILSVAENVHVKQISTMVYTVIKNM